MIDIGTFDGYNEKNSQQHAKTGIKMIAEERWGVILQLIEAKNTVTVAELTEVLNTSESTIRRDLQELDRMHKLVRVHGGATALDDSPRFVNSDVQISDRAAAHAEEKAAIGRFAAGLIGKSDFVYIDAGSTTAQLVEHITEKNAVYVTNSIGHARRLLQKGCRVILPGGEIKPVTEAMVGAQTVEEIRRYHFTIGFFGTNGVTDDTGFTTPESNEAAVKRTAMEHSRDRYVLCDHSKFSRIAPVSFGSFYFADIVTDSAVPERYRKYEHIHVV